MKITTLVLFCMILMTASISPVIAQSAAEPGDDINNSESGTGAGAGEGP